MGSRRAQEGFMYRELLGSPIHRQGGWFVGEYTPVSFQAGAQYVGYEVVLLNSRGSLLLEIWPVGSVRGGQHRSDIFEGEDKTLRERKGHGDVGPYQFPLFEK